MIKIGIDIDGTITDPSTFVPYLNKGFGRTLAYEDLKEYDLSKVLGISSSEFINWFISNELTIYKEAPVAQHLKTVIDSWVGSYELAFVSAREPYHLTVTCNWLDKHMIHYDELHLVGSKSKTGIIEKRGIQLFIEDNYENACKISESNNIPVILLNTPYNQYLTPKGVVRVNNWLEAKEWVDNWSKQFELGSRVV